MRLYIEGEHYKQRSGRGATSNYETSSKVKAKAAYASSNQQ